MVLINHYKDILYVLFCIHLIRLVIILQLLVSMYSLKHFDFDLLCFILAGL